MRQGEHKRAGEGCTTVSEEQYSGKQSTMGQDGNKAGVGDHDDVEKVAEGSTRQSHPNVVVSWCCGISR